MGYQIVFKPTQEFAEQKLKVYKSGIDTLESSLETSKLELLLYCMQDHSNVKQIREVIFQIKMYLRIIRNSVYDIQKDTSLECFKSDGEFWFCGYEFASDSNYDPNAPETHIDQTARDLALYANLIKTDDYFAEQSNFYEKLDLIEQCINDYVDSAYNDAAWQIVNDFREYTIEYDDNGNEYFPYAIKCEESTVNENE